MADGKDNRDTYAIIAIVIILLLLLYLFLRALHPTTKIIKGDDGGIKVETNQIQYNVPALQVPHPGAWDWMQTTDLACGCDVGLWKDPIVIEQIGTIITSYPSYNYITTNTASVSPSPPVNFPVYTPPPLPVWWYEWGTNVKGEINRQYIVTQLGTTLLGGKYSRAPDMWGGYGDQSKYNWTQSGPDVYYNGKRFVHDPSRDYPHPRIAATYNIYGT